MISFIHIYEFRKSFRHNEKLTLRCVHLKHGVEFNETCLNNGIFPKYCHIYICIKKRGAREGFELRKQDITRAVRIWPLCIHINLALIGKVTKFI